METSVFGILETTGKYLKLDISSEELALLSEEQAFTQSQIDAVTYIFEYLRRKKEDATVQTLLKLSKLPLKNPKTFENFNFSLIKGKDTDRLKALPSLSHIYAHKNIAFIGPAGTGKTHLAQAIGYECCRRGLKTYFIKMTELRDRMSAARRLGKESSLVTSLVRPYCLIIDEVGHCDLDKENTRLFFDFIDRRYHKEGCHNIIFTSNKHPSQWSGNFQEDDTLLCALDRIFDDASVFNIKGESYRGKKLETFAIQTNRIVIPESSETPPNKD